MANNLLDKASILLTPTAYDNGSMLSIKPENGDGDFDFQRNSAATRVNAQGLVENVQIISPELVSNGNFSEIGAEEVSNGDFSQEGSELITNGDFSTDSNWTKGSGWSILNGKAISDGSGNYQSISQSCLVSPIGKTYKVTYEVSDYVSGEVRCILGGFTLGQIISSNGLVTEYLTVSNASSNTFVYLETRGSGFTGSIDNVSVKEVGQDWTLGSGVSIADSKLTKSDPSVGTTSASQTSILTVGKTYKYSVVLSGDLSSSGSNKIVMFGTDFTSAGTYEGYYTATSGTLLIQMRGSTNIYSVENISIKEVGQHWTLGTGWEIGNNVANAVNAPFGSQLVDSTTLTASKKYSVSFVISNYIQGSVRVAVGNVFSSDVSANGSYTFILTTANTNAFKVQARGGGSGTTLSITNISVKEITDDTNLPRINYEGFSYQDALGSELLTDGVINNANGGTFTFTANGLSAISDGTSGSSLRPMLLWSTLTIGKQYRIVGTPTINSGNTNYSLYDGASYVKNQVAAEGFDLTFTCNGASVFFTNDGTQTFNIDWDLSIKEYLGQEVVPDSGCGSWLLEPQSTNLIKYSEDFSNSDWTKSKSTITSNSVISPDGTQNASLVVGDDTSTSTYIRAGGVNTVVGNTYSYSLYVKPKGNSRYLKFWARNTDASFVVFDLDNGTTDSPTTSAITDAGNGWWRVSSFGELLSSTVLCYVYPYYTATESDGFYIWGAQLEESSISSSYIPTNGASSTRLQDIANNSGNSSLINSTEGVLYAEISALADDGTIKIISLSEDANVSNRINIFYTSGSNKMKFVVRVNDSNAFIDTITLSNILDYNKVALKYKANDFAIWINGTKESEQLSGSTYSQNTLDKLNFDQGSGNYNFYGKTKALVVYKEGLTDANLRSLTYPNPVATTFDLDFDTIAEQFTFTRGSEATFVNAQGLIESTNQIGSELVTNGDFATDSDWDLGTGWSIKDGVAESDNSGSGSRNLRQDDIVESGKIYYINFDLNITSGTLYLLFGGTLGLTESKSYSLIRTSTGTDFMFRNSSGNFIGSIDNVSVKEVTTATNTPRIDYSTGKEAFLLEPQSTNTILNSNSVSTINYSSNITKINNAAISPDGTFNAMSFTPTTTQGIHRSGYHSTAGLYTQNDVVTFSGFVKANGYDFITMGGFFGNEAAVFNVSNGTLVSQQSNVISTKIVKLTNDWYRLSVTYTFQNSINNGYLYAGIYVMDTETGYSFTGDGVSGVYGYGNQAELGTGTSYIPTNGASATRNQELCKDATPVINSEEGTLYAEISKIELSSSSGAISLSDSTTINRIVINGITSSVENRYAITFKVNNTDLYSQNVTLPFDINGFTKLAIKWSGASFSIVSNGQVLYTENNNFSFPINTLNRIGFDSGTGVVNFYGRTKDLKIYPKALADVQLEDLTTI